MLTLHFSWLGPPVIEYDGRTLRLEMRKALALLAYLSLSPQSPSRESLAALFWPEYDQKHALTNLRRTLFSLTRSLPPELLEADRERIGLRSVPWLRMDVDEFHDLLSARQGHSHLPDRLCPDCLASVEQAVAFYKGDFLEGFNLKNCPGFDEWQYLQREGLRAEYGHALEMLSVYYQEQGEWEPAIRYARSWLALDRLNEPAQRRLISLYYQAGQRSLAIRQYETLVDLLQNELGQGPEAETRSLYQSLLQGETHESAGKQPPSSPASAPKSEPLIKTKLYIPPLRVERVTRPRLQELLEAGSQRALTLISAPAGFGKTTLLASWAAQTSLPIAWFSIDEDDNDPVRFVAYLVAALDSVLDLDLSEQLQVFTQSLQPSVQPVLIQLINQLAEAHEPFTLVLDDYQFIHSLEVHQALTFLLEKIPASLHLVIATRSDPPFSLARLRGRDQLVEIRMRDLRFRLDESTGFLNQVMALHLSDEDVSALEARTEGWIAGLQMAALAIRTIVPQPSDALNTLDSQQAVSQFIQAFSGSHRYILDYLGEEVLNRRPDALRSFLLQTSILGRLSGPLCDAVTGTEGSQNILESLEKENLFLVPLDNERRWYRYHHLFAELLRYQLADRLPKDSQPEGQAWPNLAALHERAADWLEKEKLFGEAIHHFIAARQYERAAALIEAQAHPMFFTAGQTYTLAEWVAEVPEDVSRSRLHLSVIKAWLLIAQNHFPDALELLEATWQVVKGRQDAEASSLIGEIALARGTLAELSSRDVTVMRSQARLAWEKLPEEAALLRCLAAWLLAASYYWDGDTRNAEKYYLQAIPLCRAAGNNYFRLVSVADFSTVLAEQGRFREAYRLLVQTQQEMSAGSQRPYPRLGHLYINSSKYLLQWNRLDEAEKHLKLGIDLAAQDTAEVLFFGISTRPYLKLAQGKREEAIQLAQDCLDRLEAYPLPYLHSLIKSFLIHFWIRVDDSDHIADWLAGCGLGTDEPIRYLNEGSFTALARVMIWQKRPDEALKILAKLGEYARSKGRNGRLFLVLALQALAYQQAKDLDGAFEALEGSLRLAKSEGYLRAYVDEGQPMEALLRLGADRGLWQPAGLGIYVDTLLEAFQPD